MNIYKKIFLFILLPVLIISQTGCSSKSAEPISKENYLLDTSCNISIYDMKGGLDKDKAMQAIDLAYKRCNSLEKILSNTIKTSDISKINDNAGNYVKVSNTAVYVLKKGIYYGDLSGGKFDITIGTLTDIWDYHTDKPKVPSDEAISDAVSHISYKGISLMGDMVKLNDPKGKIDLGGIAKGYIGDELVKVLEKAGVTSGIVNLGGNVIAIGSKSKSEPFTIGIEKPYSDRSEIIGSIKAKNQTIVTSGIYERQFKVDGKIYHHIIDPFIGRPAETDTESVTLIMDKGHSIDADALSTICLIKGSVEGKKFIEGIDGVEALFTKSDGTIIKTKGMKFNEK